MKVKSIRNIRIKTKLLFLGGVSILGLVFIGAESIITARQINQASTEISQSWVPAIIIAEELNTETSDYRIKEFYHAITHDQETMDHLEKEMMAVRDEIDAAFTEYEQNYITDETDRELMENARAYWDRYLEYSDRLLPISRGNDNEESLKMIIGESRLLFDEASGNFLKMAEFNRLGAEAASVRGDQLYARLARVKIVSICLIALMITLLVIYIIIAIDKPVKAIVEGTRRVSNGDLDVYLPYDSEDEIGILTDSVNQLIERLKNIIDDEKYLFREIGSENFEVKSTCEQAYRGDFAPILYSIASLMSRLDIAKQKKEELKKRLEERVAAEMLAEKKAAEERKQTEEKTQAEEAKLAEEKRLAEEKTQAEKKTLVEKMKTPDAEQAGEETKKNGSRTMDATDEEGRLS